MINVPLTRACHACHATPSCVQGQRDPRTPPPPLPLGLRNRAPALAIRGRFVDRTRCLGKASLVTVVLLLLGADTFPLGAANRPWLAACA